MAPHAEVVAYGDAGLLVTFTHDDREGRWAAAQALQAELLGDPSNGVVDVVAGFETAYVALDLLRTDVDRVRALVEAGGSSRPSRPPPRRFTVPVVYGGEHGPDLAAVADELGLTPAEVVARHTAVAWTVRLRASPAAAPMMDAAAWSGAVSRHPSPRTRLAPGSVGLSGRQCMVYPVESPGGWRIVGRTPAPFLDLADAELVAYRPGDQVRFVAIGADDWDTWTATRLAPDPT